MIPAWVNGAIGQMMELTVRSMKQGRKMVFRPAQVASLRKRKDHDDQQKRSQRLCTRGAQHRNPGSWPCGRIGVEFAEHHRRLDGGSGSAHNAVFTFITGRDPENGGKNTENFEAKKKRDITDFPKME